MQGIKILPFQNHKTFILRHSVLFILGVLITNLVFAQHQVAEPQVPSANAMNLGLFGEVPVSLNSGLPQISVPIYEIRTKDVYVPIVLSYHASGVRPEVHPSWVGLGWSLNAGGAITRVIKGYEDEVWCGECDGGEGLGGYYHTHALNDVANWASTEKLQYYHVYDLYNDYQPDEFHFSFPGHSGMFFMDEKGNWKVQSDKPLKVVFDGEFIEPFSNTTNSSPAWDSPDTFEKFTIIDEKGVQYIFGEGSAIEYSDVLMTYHPDEGQDIKSSRATTWNLKRIVSPDGRDVVEFNYERGPYQASLYKSYYSAIECGGTVYGSKVGGRLISPVYLASITHERSGLQIDFSVSKSSEMKYSGSDFNKLFDDHFGGVRRGINELVNTTDGIPYFHRAPGNTDSYPNQWDRLIWLKLDGINISSETKNLKSLSFVYDNSPTERLRLSKINYWYTSTPFTAYTFDYYENYPLPAYLTVFGDHWGFNNNVAMTGISTDPATFKSQKGLTDHGRAISGTLKSITYPTKGKTVFEYEQHSYAQIVASAFRFLYWETGQAGGLRVKKIKNYDNMGNEGIKEYFYVTGYSPERSIASLRSSGILEAKPEYELVGWADNLAGDRFSYYNFSSNPVVPMSSNSSGQHISYDEVVEKREDGAYTIFKYTNHLGNWDLDAVNTFNPQMMYSVPYNSRDFERGKLLEENLFNVDGNPVQSTRYIFERPANIDGYAVRNIHQEFRNSCTGSATETAITRTAYLLYYYPFHVKGQIRKSYGNLSSNDVVTTSKIFSYNTEGLLESEEATNSNGEKISTIYSYAYDYSGTMRQKNMLDYKRSIQTANQGQVTSLKTIEYGEYPTDPGNIYPKKVKERASYGDPDITAVEFDAYDEGNVAQQTLVGGTKESFEWGYNNTLPIARVLNAQNNYSSYYVPEEKSGTVVTTRDTKSVTFTTHYTSNVTLAIRLTSPPTLGFFVATRLYGADFNSNVSLCFAYGQSGCGPNSPDNVTYNNLPPGTYTLEVSASTQVFANIDYSYQGRKEITSGVKEFYFQNFEETDWTNGGAHTGNKYVPSSYYGVSWTRPNNKEYVISYWYKSDGEWKYSGELPYNTSYYTLSNGSAYDDIRVYPKDAQMTTYTYDPLVGMTSAIGPDGETTYYYYDAYGRLERIEDQDRKVIEKYNYNYAQ